MRLVEFARGAECAQGYLEGEQVSVVGGWQRIEPEWLRFTLPASDPQAIRQMPVSEVVPLASVRLLSPVDVGTRIFCIGINYRAHAQEASRAVPPVPSVFMRTLASLQPHEAPLAMPRASPQYDFEGEIAVVISRAADAVAREQALSHVGGYTCFMDGSVRDFQKQSLIAGKNFERSGAIGPWITTADEVGDPTRLELTTRLNGQEVQHATADMMIYDIPTIVSYISSWMPLRPGDVIATGTPEGVGLSRVPPLWMKPGDRIEVSVGGVGRLRNTVEAA